MRYPPPKSPLRWHASVLVQETFAHWSSDNATRLAASLAYYSVLATAPLLVISVAVAELVFGQKPCEGQLAWEIQDFVGGNASQAIQAAIQALP